jgi:hypothetical protein
MAHEATKTVTSSRSSAGAEFGDVSGDPFDLELVDIFADAPADITPAIPGNIPAPAPAAMASPESEEKDDKPKRK